jgi:hypothetical protein
MNEARTRPRNSLLALALGCVCMSALGAVGCRVRPLTMPGSDRDPRALPGAPDNRATRVDDAQVSLKRVTAKEPPSMLIADDGSRCTVSEKRYDETRIGHDALCMWRSR